MRDRTKFSLIAAFLLLLFAIPLVAQSATLSAPTMTVKKFSTETTTFAWDYDVNDETVITHFSLKWVDDLTKTALELKTIPKNLRATSVSAAFTPGFKFTYYAVTAVNNTVPTAVWESAPSNTVATERVGRPPSNNRVQ